MQQELTKPPKFPSVNQKADLVLLSSVSPFISSPTVLFLMLFPMGCRMQDFLHTQKKKTGQIHYGLWSEGNLISY